MPFFAPFTGAMALREPFNRNVFHLRASYNDETALIVKQLTRLGLKKIAVFYQNDAYGKAGLDGVELALAQLDLKPVGAGHGGAQLGGRRRRGQDLVARTPDAMVQISAYKSCAAFIREARKAGYGGTFFNVSFVGTQALADELGKDGAGVVVTQVVPSPYNAANGDHARIQRGGEARAAATPRPTSPAWKATSRPRCWPRACGARRARPTRDGLIAGLESIDRQQFGGFEVSFSPRDHVASKFVELSMITGDGRIRT